MECDPTVPHGHTPKAQASIWGQMPRSYLDFGCLLNIRHIKCLHLIVRGHYLFENLNKQSPDDLSFGFWIADALELIQEALFCE
jgi:hypothetical protein